MDDDTQLSAKGFVLYSLVLDINEEVVLSGQSRFSPVMMVHKQRQDSVRIAKASDSLLFRRSIIFYVKARAVRRIQYSKGKHLTGVMLFLR